MGFIGRRLAAELAARGAEVIGVDRRGDDHSAHSRRADLSQPGVLDGWLTPETVVFHLAGHTSVAGSVRDPQHDFASNVAAFTQVLESVRAAGASLVFTSSAAVFDPESPLPHEETAPKRPVSPYGAAKLACEAYCSAYFQSFGLNLKVARLFNVYGPGMTRFAIFDFYRKIREAETRLEILGDGAQTRDYLFIDDAVAGLIAIAERGRPGEDYNLATGRPITSLELAQRMRAMMGKPNLEIQTTGQSFPGDVPRWYADVSKLSALGFTAQTSLEEGLRATIAHLDAQTPAGSNAART
jgi:UDP-glucose 4-epimerase